MRIRTAGLAALLLATTPAITPAGTPSASAADTSTVFRAGDAGYHTFRIPAIVRTAPGTLLAFAEARRNSADDFGDIDLVLRRSTDSGRSWGAVRVVAGFGAGKAGNPVPIVDRGTGEVVLLSTVNSARVTDDEDVLTGRIDDRRVWVQTSGDDGLSWSRPREITATAKHDSWRWYATGPGHGLQLAGGEHAGRLVACADHSTPPPPGGTDTGAEPKYFGDHLIYSDDGGTNWRIGATDDDTSDGINPNECGAAQAGADTVYVNSRDHKGSGDANRAAARSTDAGNSFAGPFRDVAGLTTPVVQGSVSNLDPAGTGRRLVFSAPSDTGARTDLAVWISRDGGHAWSAPRVVVPGPAAYSDLVPLGGDRVGVLAERGARDPYQEIVYLEVDASSPPAGR